MKVIILAGGMGTRISEESDERPKPMIEIGGMPILWHIMKGYSAQGFTEFIICAGYKQNMIKEWFANYSLYASDVTFDFTAGKRETIVHRKKMEPWKVTVLDTGLHTETGGRIKRAEEYTGDGPFMVTYGDGVGDIDINAVLEFHRKSGRKATITTYVFKQNKGIVEYGKNGEICELREKADSDGKMVNAGFMVFEPDALNGLLTDETPLEDALSVLAQRGELSGYVHTGFWQCMDTLREKKMLEEMWRKGNPPWKIWKD